MIVIENLTKNFKNKAILKELTLTIKKGQIYGVVGTSGAGKSTLLRCLNGLEAYEGGSVKVNRREVKQLTEKEQQVFRKNIGMIFQDFTLLSRKNVFENIALPMKCWGKTRLEIDARVNHLLKVVGLEEKAEFLPSQLSGGQKQRVAIARALTLKPELLLCDEATSALDPKTTNEILELLADINQQLGLTIVLVTHQIHVVKKICHEMALIEAGTVVASGWVVRLFFEEGNYLKNLLGRNNGNDTLQPGMYVKILAEGVITQSLLYQLSQEVDAPYLLMKSEIETYRNVTYGIFIIKVPKNQAGLFEEFFKRIDCVYRLFETEAVR